MRRGSGTIGSSAPVDGDDTRPPSHETGPASITAVLATIL
jgi:hypothetical protein